MRRSEAEWAKLWQEFDTSGETCEGFCTRHRLRVKTFRWWRSELRRRGRSGARAASKSLRFLPVRVRDAAPMPATLEVVVSDVVLRVPIGADVVYVASLAAALNPRC